MKECNPYTPVEIARLMELAKKYQSMGAFENCNIMITWNKIAKIMHEEGFPARRGDTLRPKYNSVKRGPHALKQIHYPFTEVELIRFVELFEDAIFEPEKVMVSTIYYIAMHYLLL